jgi:hypothetical protein
LSPNIADPQTRITELSNDFFGRDEKTDYLEGEMSAF